MMSLAIGLTRWWVRLYTRGLPPEARDARRAEIESDLWEQGEDATANGSQPDETALQVFVRLLLGIPADLSWRLEAGARRRQREKRSVPARRSNMDESRTMRGFLVLALLVSALPIIWGASRIVGEGGAGPFWGFGTLLAGVALATGLALGAKRPQIGLRLVAVGMLGVWVLWFWMFFITVPVGLLVIWFAVSRARRFARERNRIATA